MKKITAEEFEKLFGRPPFEDDLDRVNCDKAGDVGHWMCGWCLEHGVPKLKCGTSGSFSVSVDPSDINW